MATIPGHFARERMEPSRMPRASAWYLSRTGGGLEAAGMAEFGRAMQDVSADAIERIIARRSQSQELEGTSEWERHHTQFFIDLVKDQDFENYGKKYKKFATSLRKQIIKKGLTGPARQNLEAYISIQGIGKEKEVAGAFLRKQRDYQRVSAFESVIRFEQAGDFVGAISAINRARKAGFMSGEEALARKQKINANIALYQANRIIQTAHEGAKAMPYKQAIQYLNDLGGITSAQRNDLIKRRERQNEIETATTNRKVRWDTIRKVTKNPRSVTDDDLEGLVKPNSLTWDDAEEIRKIRDTKGHPLKSDRALIRFNQLDLLYKNGKLTDLKYDVKNEKLKEWFEANPDATAKQAQENWDELMEDTKRSLLWDLFKRAIVPPIVRVAGKEIERRWGKRTPLERQRAEEGEPTNREEFEAAVRSIENEDEAKAYYQKWAPKWQ